MTSAPAVEPRPVRVALSNDYEIALLGLAQMLAAYPTQVRLVEMTTRPDLAHRPDIILFDTFGRLPDEDTKLQAIVEANPDAKVVLFSSEHYPEDAVRRPGVAGYLHKSLTADQLVAALLAIHENRPLDRNHGKAELPLSWPGQAVGLSMRESEILSFIARGLTNEEITKRAYLSINTVKTYIRTAYRKIGARNRAQAVAWAFRNGFEPTDDTGLYSQSPSPAPPAPRASMAGTVMKMPAPRTSRP